MPALAVEERKPGRGSGSPPRRGSDRGVEGPRDLVAAEDVEPHGPLADVPGDLLTEGHGRAAVARPRNFGVHHQQVAVGDVGQGAVPEPAVADRLTVGLEHQKGVVAGGHALREQRAGVLRPFFLACSGGWEAARTMAARQRCCPAAGQPSTRPGRRSSGRVLGLRHRPVRHLGGRRGRAVMTLIRVCRGPGSRRRSPAVRPAAPRLPRTTACPAPRCAHHPRAQAWAARRWLPCPSRQGPVRSSPIRPVELPCRSGRPRTTWCDPVAVLVEIAAAIQPPLRSLVLAPSSPAAGPPGR